MTPKQRTIVELYFVLARLAVELCWMGVSPVEFSAPPSPPTEGESEDEWLAKYQEFYVGVATRLVTTVQTARRMTEEVDALVAQITEISSRAGK